MRSKIKVVLFLTILIKCMTLSGYELIFDFEPEVDESSPVIAIIPFGGTAMIDKELQKELYDRFITCFVKEYKYQVQSVAEWVEKNYGDYSFSSTDHFLASLKRGRMPVDKVVWGNLTYFEHEYVFTLYWYDVKSKKKSMYQRPISGEKIDGKESEKQTKIKKALAKEVSDSILKELNIRNENETRLFYKNVLVKKTKTKYFNYTTLSTGLQQYNEIPFIQYKDTPLEGTDDFFSSIFEYSFYKAGIVKEYSDTLGKYLLHDTPDLRKFNYIIDSELRISNDFSILNISVIDTKLPENKNVIMDYNFPIDDISVKALENLAQKNCQLVIMNILNTEETKKIGVLDMNQSAKWVHSNMKGFKKSRGGSNGPVVYINEIYCGPLKELNEQILPFGLNSVLEGDSIYKVFVSPYWMNTLYFSEKDSLLMEME